MLTLVILLVFSSKLVSSGTLMFSGLDPARLRISSNGDQHYSYKPGEYLNIGCETGNEAKTFKFCNTTSRECSNIIPAYRKFELQATTELNYSYLLCTIAGDHICLYWDNHEGPQTPPRDPSAPVAPQQPNTRTARSAQPTTTAISSAYRTRRDHPRAAADKIWFTGFPSAPTVTETHLAATYYVYKYKNNEEFNVNCNADPGDGRIIFRYADVNNIHASVRIESFNYRATSATNGSSLLCVLQNENDMNVYSKRVTLLLDTAATTPNATNKPETRTTKRTNPPRKPSTTKKPRTTKAPRRTWGPRTTKAPKTTKAPETTRAPTTNPAQQDVNSRASTAVVQITGEGLILVDDSIQYQKKYSYHFKKEQDLELVCTVSGVLGNFQLILEIDHNIVGRNQKMFPRGSTATLAVSHTFKLTSESRIINCIAIDLHTNNTEKFKSTVNLHYEDDSTAAPSTANTAKRTVAPLVAVTTGPPQYPDELIKNVVIAGACVVIVVLILVVIRYRRFVKQVNPNKMPENIRSRPPMDLPPEVVYEEVYSHGAGLQRPQRQQAPSPRSSTRYDYVT